MEAWHALRDHSWGVRAAMGAYEPGTARATGGTIELTTDDGVERAYRLEVAGTPADVQGGGYYRGWADGGGPGVPRGEVEEYDDYDASPGPEQSGLPHVPPARRLGLTEFPMVMVGPGGAEGMAHVEHSLRGA